MEFELNGIKYKAKDNPQSFKPNKVMSKPLLLIQAMLAMSQGTMSPGAGNRSPEEPKVNIIEEYGLIQQKKSQLSRRQREWVVWKFEKYFEPINE